MKKYLSAPIVEVFESIQGEGKSIGKPSTFVRFYGCNLRCIGYQKGRAIPYIEQECKQKKLKPIWEIKKGDKILSVNENTLQLEETTVTDTFEREVDEWLYIKFKGKGNIIVTPEHPFLSEDNKWVLASNLKKGDILQDIKFNEKLSFIKLRERNPMRDKDVMARKLKHTDYVAMGQKLSTTIKTKQSNGTYAASLTSLKKNNPEKYEQYIESRKGTITGNKNPMKNIDTRRKVMSYGGFDKVNSLSSGEKKFIKLLEKWNLTNLIEYCGAGKLNIPNYKQDRVRNPDFLVRGTNKVIEISTTKRGQYGKNSKKFYGECGYKCLPLNVSESEDMLKDKVFSFLRNGLVVKSIKSIKSHIVYRYKNRKQISKKIERMKVYNLKCNPNHNFIVKLGHSGQRLISHNCQFQGESCDTPYAVITEKDKSKMMTSSLLAYKIRLSQSTHIIFTGGEPMLYQSFIVDVMKKVQEAGVIDHCEFTCEIETNGTISPSLDFDNIVNRYNISPKLKSSNQEEGYDDKRINLEALSDFPPERSSFKFVLTNRDEDLVEIVELHKKHPEIEVYLMPEGMTREEIIKNSPQVVDACLEFGFMFSPREHIIIWDKQRGV